MASTQQQVLDYLRGKPQGMTFVHGKAGSGKTYLIRQIESGVAGCLVLAPTNLAASLYRFGQTFHSYFWRAFDKLDEGYQNPANLSEQSARSMASALRNVRLMVIDEISMVRADTLQMIDAICRMALGEDKPFGGIPTVFVGDLFQLPPVADDPAVSLYLEHEYGGLYFFDSHVVRDNIESIRLFELEFSYRQKSDPEFATLLDSFRSPMSDSQKVEILERLNTRVTSALPTDAVYMAASNDGVSRINSQKLMELPGPVQTVQARYSVRLKGSTEHVELVHSDLPTDLDIAPIAIPSQYEAVLSFKPGARVMITQNCKRFGYYNGDFGTITDFDGHRFTILLDRGKSIQCPDPSDRYAGGMVNHYRYEMEYNEELHRLVRKSPYLQRTRQFPVKLAYAFTIHKSQGQSYDKVILDLDSHIFAPGQLYVALSRARTFDGLFLTRPVTFSDIIVDDRIFSFLYRLRIANGLIADPEQERVRRREAIHNTRCDDFIAFVRMNEKNPSTLDFLCHTIEAYRSVFALGKMELAHEELMKITQLICGTYITERYDDLLERLRHPDGATSDDCRYDLNAIFEIYTDVVNAPRVQVRSDTRFLPK